MLVFMHNVQYLPESQFTNVPREVAAKFFSSQGTNKQICLKCLNSMLTHAA